MPLFTADQLTRQLQYSPEETVSEQDATQVEWIVDGWLSEATGKTDAWTEPIPKVVRAWAIELGGIALENPTSMESDTAGDVSSAWRDRRSQILAQARVWGEEQGYRSGSGRASSRGSFPPALPWPDPARACW